MTGRRSAAGAALLILASCATQGNEVRPQGGEPAAPPPGATAQGATPPGATPPGATAPQQQGTAAPQQPQEAQEGQRPVTQAPKVVVTARKMAELPADVPQSVTAVTESKIRDAGLNTVKDASYYVPNTLVTEFSSRRLSFPFVRGVGSGQGDPAITTFIDGVPQLTVSSTNLAFLDVERVEFMRGPLGALYGRNTIGGGIQVITNQPTNTTELDAGLTLGNFDYQDYRASLSTPLVEDQLFFNAAAMHSQRDGYTVNDFTGNDVDSRNSTFGRTQLRWNPDDRNEFHLAIYGERSRDGGFVLSDLQGLRARPNHINQDFEGSADRDIAAGSLTWNNFGDDVQVTSITGLQDWSIEESADFDFSALDGVRRFTTEDQTYVTQELRFASPEDEGVALGTDDEMRWLLGVSGFYSDSGQSAANDFRPGGAGILFPPAMVGTDLATGSFEDYAFAIFGQLTFDLDDRWELTAALRYDYEVTEADLDRTFISGGFPVPVSAAQEREAYDEILPRFSVAHRWSEAAMAYGLAAKGFKAGGFNLTSPAGQEAFAPETSWTYEAGVKTSWLEDQLSANAAVFYIDWDDMQLSQFDAASGGYVSNAGAANSAGVELELVGRPATGLELFGAVGYLDTEFDEFIDPYGQDVSGRDLPFAPDTTGNLGAQYTAELDDVSLFTRLEYFHVGRFFYDPGNLQGERYNLVNLRIGAGGEQWRLEAWVRNVFDERYIPVAFQPSPADPTLFVGESAAPRTFGVTVRVTF